MFGVHGMSVVEFIYLVSTAVYALIAIAIVMIVIYLCTHPMKG